MALTFVAQSHTPCRRKPALFDALFPKSQLQETPERAGPLLGTDRDSSRPRTTPKTLSGFFSRRLFRLLRGFSGDGARRPSLPFKGSRQCHSKNVTEQDYRYPLDAK